MSGFLIDTNCISELVRRHPEPRVLEWFDAADESLLYLSVLTLGEIRKGVATLAQGTRRTRLESWLAHDLPERFSGRILAIDTPVADRRGSSLSPSETEGRRPARHRRPPRRNGSSSQPYRRLPQHQRLHASPGSRA